jgi:hypothetical protein
VIPIVHKGAIYTRRAGINQIVTSADFERLLARSIDRYRQKILEGVTRVVEASPDHEVLTVVPSRDAAGTISVTVEGGPERRNLRGRPLKVTVDSVIEKIGLLWAIAPQHQPALGLVQCPQIKLEAQFRMHSPRQLSSRKPYLRMQGSTASHFTNGYATN